MFQLNRPALLTAGQILNQQCAASAAAALSKRNAGRKKPGTPEVAEDHIFAAIESLTSAARNYRAPVTVPRSVSGALAAAAAEIFCLAEALEIDLGEAIADKLQAVANGPASA
jgi:hypothetical protein